MALPQNKIDKAAHLLSLFGSKVVGEVLRLLPENEARLLAARIMQAKELSADVKNELINEFNTLYGAIERGTRENIGDKKHFVSDNPVPRQKGMPFESLHSVEANRILEHVANEPAGIIALVLYYLSRDKAAQILAGLTDEIRQESTIRLANMQTPLPQVVAHVEDMLIQRITNSTSKEEEEDESFEPETDRVPGTRALVEILGRSAPGIEKGVYDFLQERDPELAAEVRKQMFVFEDITRLEARSIQVVLRELSSQELALALKGADSELQELVFANVSDNFGKAIREEVELLGPVRAALVTEARQKLADTVCRLVEEGTITISRGEEEEMMV